MVSMKWPSPEEPGWFELLEESTFPLAWKTYPVSKKIGEPGMAFPAIAIYNKKGEIVVKAEIPGIEKESIDISFVDNRLVVKGWKKKEEEVLAVEEEEDYYYSELSYGNFTVAFNIPVKVQADKVEASFNNDTLEIHLPKAEEAKPKEIKVEVK